MKLYKTLFIKLALQSLPFATSELFFLAGRAIFCISRTVKRMRKSAHLNKAMQLREILMEFKVL